MRVVLTSLFLLVAISGWAAAGRLDMQAVNDAGWSGTATGRLAADRKPRNALSSRVIDPLLIKAQVLLDRARFSPGEIDGKYGDNFKLALTEFTSAESLSTSGILTEEVWQKLVSRSPAPVLTQYKLTDDDVRGPFIDKMPGRMEQMKDLPALGYISVREKLAEQFHMSQELLQALNSGRQFTAGETIVVADVSGGDLAEKVTRIQVDKTAQRLRVFGKENRLIASYPATVGSDERPTPDGTLTVAMITTNPTYRYNPKYAFKGVRAKEPFTIKPGPNNPVGLTWIGLKPGEGYGIHGTPEPGKVGKTSSHGCVRLTNWDAMTLARATPKGTPVEFSGDQKKESGGIKSPEVRLTAQSQ